jgi:hypothetical protein
MARYETGVRANLRFHTKRPPFTNQFPEAEQVVIEFEGREFVWHPNLEPGPEGQEWWPNVTVMVVNPDDYVEEMTAMQRFLSALAYEFETAVEPMSSGAAGWPGPLDRPVAMAARRGYGDRVSEAPLGLVVEDDDRLRLVLALNREGLNSESPFYKFLSFWNALDAAFDNDEPAMAEFLNRTAPLYAGHRSSYDDPPSDWADYLRESNRNAIAHAVRPAGRPLLDPDDPLDRERIYRDSRLLQDLVRARVRERWPSGVRIQRRVD